MAIKQLTQQFSMLSLFAKVGIGVAVLVVIALLMGGTAGIVSRYKDRRADKAIAAEQAKSQEHRQRADEAEAKAKALETDKKLAELALEAISKQNAAKQEQLKAEDARAAEDAAQAGETVDAVERCRRLCSRAKRLKLIVESADCGC